MRRLVPLLIVVALAGCGGGSARNGASTSSQQQQQQKSASVYPDDPQLLARAATPTQRQDLERLWRDTQAVRTAAAATHGRSLKGGARVRRATSRFIEDLDASQIDNLSKNRAIDHAAAAVAVVCDQCFQQLEAIRPIPAIAH
jgi:hypothetical protein